MEALTAYLATDRRSALAGSFTLPERSRGTALFADVSGFTALTEALAQGLGPRRGAEELSTHLNSVYEALIEVIHEFDGSVIAFAGDAITCWFEEDAGEKATAAALELQKAMDQFSEVRLLDGRTCSLAVKTGVAAGPVRRFLVGNPQIHLLDVIAGNTLVRMADATSLASRQETILAPECVAVLGSRLQIKEWRTKKDAGEKYAVVGSLDSPMAAGQASVSGDLEEALLRPHLLKPVYDRLRAGKGEFLTELRPAVAIFLKFEGLDYDNDPEVGGKLDRYVRWVQQVVDGLGGFLLAVSMGDKGSFLYCCFGAPVAHEDNAVRAISAADSLRKPPVEFDFITQTRIGVSSGTLRTGAYGATVRRTYGVLGDPVNLAARLMEHAAPGQVLVSEEIRRDTKQAFEWQTFAPIKAKGKSGLIPVLALLGPTRRGPGQVSEPQYALPLVGRVPELGIIREKLQRSTSARGQVLAILSEAGLGKSRLAAEALRLGREQGCTTFIGQCQSHGAHASYLPWKDIWQGIFGLPIEAPLAEQIAHLERFLHDLNPVLVPRLPLLGPLLQLPIPDNDVTAPLEPRLRKASLETLLVECLRGVCKRGGTLVLLLEDCHWMDALSLDLLQLLVRALPNLPAFLMLTQRPQDASQAQFPELRQSPHYGEIALNAFSPEDAEMLVGLKLAQLFDSTGPVPPDLLRLVLARSAGNPFYLEELLNYLKDQRIDFRDPVALGRLELPASLHTLILSRIDRLTESQQASLKVASVIGRLFPAAVLWGVQAGSGKDNVLSDLKALCDVDLTAVDRPEPELVYIFKHVVTQEVAYESLPHSIRARLHNEIGQCLENLYSDRVDQHLDLLAFHFDRSENVGKRRDYLLLAGQAAQARYANSTAITYYEKVLPLLSSLEKIPVLLKLGKVLELTGVWKKAGACYQKAFEVAEEIGDRQSQARCQAATGDLLRKQGLFSEATDWLGIARTAFEDIGDRSGVGQSLHAAGTVAAMQGDYDKARELYEQSLVIRKEIDDKAQIASLLSNLGIIARYKNDHKAARELMEESLEIRRELGDRWAIANSLNNLGVVLRDIRELPQARALLEESLALNRQVGDSWAVANVLSSLAEVCLEQKDWEAVRTYLHESLQINLDLEDRTAVAFNLECFAGVAAAQNHLREAMVLAGAASAVRRLVGSPLSPPEEKQLELFLAPARAGLTSDEQAASYALGAAMSFDEALAEARRQ